MIQRAFVLDFRVFYVCGLRGYEYHFLFSCFCTTQMMKEEVQRGFSSCMLHEDHDTRQGALCLTCLIGLTCLIVLITWSSLAAVRTVGHSCLNLGLPCLTCLIVLITWSSLATVKTVVHSCLNSGLPPVQSAKVQRFFTFIRLFGAHRLRRMVHNSRVSFFSFGRSCKKHVIVLSQVLMQARKAFAFCLFVQGSHTLFSPFLFLYYCKRYFVHFHERSFVLFYSRKIGLTFSIFFFCLFCTRRLRGTYVCPCYIPWGLFDALLLPWMKIVAVVTIVVNPKNHYVTESVCSHRAVHRGVKIEKMLKNPRMLENARK